MIRPTKSYFRIRDGLIEMAGIKEGYLILDVGTWYGYTAIEIGKRYDKVRVIGVDISGKAISKARENVKKEGLKDIEFKIAEAENLPFDDNSFDLVVSNMALGHFSSMPKAVSEMARVAREGSKIAISGWIPPVPMRAMMRIMTKIGLRGLLGKLVPLPKMKVESKGFTIEGMVKAVEKMVERAGAVAMSTELVGDNAFICIGGKGHGKPYKHTKSVKE